MLSVRTLAAGLLVLALAPTAARADGLITPFWGANFGGDAGSELSDAVDANRFAWGVSAGWMGAGIIGFEGDLGYSPDFFGKTDAGNTRVLTLLGNVVVGVPFGGQTGFGIRPYAFAGAGILRTDIEGLGVATNVVNFDQNQGAWDFGAGVFIFFATHVGARVDLRYLRSFDDLDLGPINIPIGDVRHPGKVDFTRFSAGVTFRF
jgi:opacity protein-like surface antigen